MNDRSHALSPLDGRYGPKTRPLAAHFSEFALMRARLLVEVEWFLFLAGHDEIAELPRDASELAGELRALVEGFDDDAMAEIRGLEQTLNHDVKAVEYYLKARVDELGLVAHREFVHFACTSEDINNTAYAIMLRSLMVEVMIPACLALRAEIAELARREAATPTLAWTHGQAATPTTIGKELAVFVARIDRQLDQAGRLEYLGKLNGATGTFSAHVAAYPDAPWPSMSEQFVTSLGLTHNPITTQIEPHDWIAECLHLLIRVNTILQDFASDMWHYISLGVFKSSVAAGEVGSSTMPHKVNPIDFENAEANCGVGSAILAHLAQKLPVSRMQRDLSDSSALRNLGAGFGHTYLAIASCRRGFARVEVDRLRVAALLDATPEVLSEAVQTVMRKHGVDEPYERLKEMTRGKQIDLQLLRALVRSVDGLGPDRDRLLSMEPRDYVGLAEQLAHAVLGPSDVQT